MCVYIYICMSTDVVLYAYMYLCICDACACILNSASQEPPVTVQLEGEFSGSTRAEFDKKWNEDELYFLLQCRCRARDFPFVVRLVLSLRVVVRSVFGLKLVRSRVFEWAGCRYFDCPKPKTLNPKP